MEILAEAVRFFAGGRQILQGIDLELRPKEFLGIIGPNGSGKSTFLKCVYRVQKPTTGKIYFNGKKLDEFSYRESALKLAVVAQHNFYNFDFSVLDVVLMGRSPHKKMMERDNAEDYKIARDALRVVGLEEFGERNFSTLSGGEQQRVILAMYCDRLIAISGGKVAGIGTPRELLTAEFIKKLYGVDSRVDIEEATGRMNIVYLPRHWKKETPQVST